MNSTVSLEANEAVEVTAVKYRCFYEHAQFVTGLILYPIVCFVGLTGNILTVAVMTDVRMRSSTNSYLLSLAVSDSIKLIVDTAYFVVILAIRIDPVFGSRAYGYLYPYAHYFFNASLCTTAWLTVSVAADRYILVCRTPTSWRALRSGASSVNRSRVISALVFVSMAILSVPFAVRYRAVHLLNDATNETAVSLHVTELWTNEQFADGFVWFQNSIRSIVPLALLAVLNTLILRVLLNSSSSSSTISANPTATELHRRRQNASETTTSAAAANRSSSQPTAKAAPGGQLADDNCSGEVQMQHKQQQIRRTETGNGNLTTADRKLSTSRRRIAVMLVTVVIMFTVCITPDAVMSTVFGFGYHDESYLVRGIREITDFLLTVNSAFNFVIYYAFNPAFRRRLRSTVYRFVFCCCCCCCCVICCNFSSWCCNRRGPGRSPCGRSSAAAAAGTTRNNRGDGGGHASSAADNGTGDKPTARGGGGFRYRIRRLRPRGDKAGGGGWPMMIGCRVTTGTRLQQFRSTGLFATAHRTSPPSVPCSDNSKL